MAVNIRWGGDLKWMRIVQADGRGYYGNLPAIFIYDLSYNFFFDVEDQKMTCPKYVYMKFTKDGKAYNKYYLGTAVLQAPFFLMAHFTSYLAGEPMDGYSKLYFKFIHLGGIFYLVLGLWFLARFLSFYGIKEVYILLTIIFILFGTNLLYYGVYENSLSHVYSFFLMSAFAYYAHRFFYRFRKRQIIYLGALLGLIVIVRPINGIIIFSLPLIAGRVDMLKLGWEKIRTNPLAVSLGIIGGFVFIFMQLLVYKVGTGHWFIFSYENESGFIWSGANIYNFLFSYKKGLFLYTPMYLVSMILGFYFLPKNRFRYFALLGFLIFVIYMVSAWWQWWYGGSFSSRVMVEYLPFFALPIAFALNTIKNRYKLIGLLTLLIAITLLCILQTAQFHYGLIHFVDMDKEWYWRVFLKIP